jgi:hypothetical protein
VRAGAQDTLLPGTERLDKQVADASGGGQRRDVPGVLMVGEEADEIVFVHPDIPIGAGEKAEALVGQVGAEVTVGFLGGDERVNDAVELGTQVGITGVAPGQRGGMQPLADVFADPRVTARFWRKPASNGSSSTNNKPVERVVLSAEAEETFQGNGGWRRQFEGIRESGGNGPGQGIAGGQGCLERHCRQEQGENGFHVMHCRGRGPWLRTRRQQVGAVRAWSL